MKFIFYRTSLHVMYEDNINFCTFFACTFISIMNMSIYESCKIGK